MMKVREKRHKIVLCRTPNFNVSLKRGRGHGGQRDPGLCRVTSTFIRSFSLHEQHLPQMHGGQGARTGSRWVPSLKQAPLGTLAKDMDMCRDLKGSLAYMKGTGGIKGRGCGVNLIKTHHIHKWNSRVIHFKLKIEDKTIFLKKSNFDF